MSLEGETELQEADGNEAIIVDSPDLVSVVIPTRDRAELAARAVRSVLAQTWHDLEVVVVIDGPDSRTEFTLRRIDDDRLRLVRLAENVGGSSARNSGVASSRGKWVAFLDDDDEWLPTKLEQQIGEARAAVAASPIVCTRVLAKSPLGEYVWPRRLPGADEPLSEYLFSRRGLFQGEGLIQSSMILAPRDLFLRVPFTAGLPGHQDWDWILRAGAVGGTAVLFVPEALAVWHVEDSRQSVSRQGDWQQSLEWIRSVQHLVTPRGFSSFILTSVGSRASEQRAWGALLPLLIEALRLGRPRVVELLVYAGLWFVPRRVRWLLRRVLSSPSMR
jgi:glycosyltransferase involved in cell wall biosynthesis